MFRRRAKTDPDANPSTQPPSPAAEAGLEELPDRLAELLRAWADGSFDLDDVGAGALRDYLNGWARHALMGGERPSLDSDPLPALGEGLRDWTGLSQSVRSLRERESGYVQRSFSDLRQVISVFVYTLGRAIRADRCDDSQLERSVEGLKYALQDGDTQRLRSAAAGTVDLIETVVERHRSRHESELRELSSRLDQITAQLQEARGQLEVDPLTQVYSRGSLDQHLGELVELGTLVGRGATLFMIDVDHFKWVNDRFGHPVGDEVLTRVAGCLRSSFKRGGDFVARYGGDEFAAIIQDDTESVAHTLAERTLFKVRDFELEHPDGEEPIRISVSIGAATLHPGEEATTWVARADRALYAAKEQGRDRAVVVTEVGEEATTDTETGESRPD